jgi:hypothetical protein
MAGRRAQRQRRQQILERAVEIGDEAAAIEFGVTIRTLRKWRGEPEPDQPQTDAEPRPPAQSESKPEPPEKPKPGPQAKPATPEPERTEDAENPRLLDDLERMRRAAEAADIVANLALHETNRLLGLGRASDARNAAAAGGSWAKKAIEWRELIAEAEQQLEREQAQVNVEIADQLADRVRSLLGALGVPLDHPAVREAVRAMFLGKPIPADVAERARHAAADALAPAVNGEVEVVPEREPLARLPLPKPPHPDGVRAEQAEREAEEAERGELARPQRKVQARRFSSLPSQGPVRGADLIADDGDARWSEIGYLDAGDRRS